MYPSLEDLRSLERATLRRITEIGEFSKLGEVQEVAEGAARAIDEKRGGVNVNLAFTLDIRLRGERRRRLPVPRRIDVGALIEPSPDSKAVRRATYSLIICRYANPASSPIVRKAHFDYEPADCRNPAEPKPSVHMQMCGNLSPHHLRAGYNEIRLRSLYPTWEKPRIPLAPTSLALMLNWLFLEFQSDSNSQAILKSPLWRTLVAQAERAVLLPYFEAATTFLTSTAQRNRRFTQAHLYQMNVD